MQKAAAAELAEAKRTASVAAARVRELEEALTSATLRSECELREALAAAAAEGAAALAAGVAEAQAAAAAASARAAALEDQLRGTEQLATRLTATLQAKAAADNEVARLVTAGTALSVEAALLRDARALAEQRAADGEARGAAAERAVAERVRQTLAAAEACVAAADAVKCEVEERAAAAGACAALAVAEAEARAAAAEAELARRVLLLDAFAEATAAKEAALGALGTATQRIAALEEERDALRAAHAVADATASAASARAEAAEAAVDSELARREAAAQEQWDAAKTLLEARVEHLPLEVTLARAEAAGAAAAAAAAEERLAALGASAERERASLQRALRAAEGSLADWKARALAAEHADGDAARQPGGRLRATLQGAQLRQLLASGPRGEAWPDWDAYAETAEEPRGGGGGALPADAV